MNIFIRPSCFWFITLRARAALPLLAATLAVAVLVSCAPHSINPDPQPLRTGPERYSQEAAANARLGKAWYESFGDAKLNRLISKALENNLDIYQAIARLAQAEAMLGQSARRHYPELELAAQWSKRWEDGRQRGRQTSLGASLSWEIDAFRRLRSMADSDRFLVEAANNDVDAVRLNLAATTAETYYSAVASHIQINLLHDQANYDQEFLKLVELRFQQGVGTNVDVLQQRSQLSLTQSLLPPALASLRTFENRLDVLLGQAPDARNRTSGADRFAEVGDLPPLGVPSDLLLERPDLRAARARLVAADADIGVAMADRLPRLTLTGSYYYEDGPGAINPLGTLLGGLVQPLLDWGRRKAEVERNKALYEEQLAAFTQAWLQAIEEVENALYQESRQREYVLLLNERRDVLEQNVAAAQEVFKQGLSDYLPVLDALQDLRQVERNLVQQQLQLILLRIQLFRALGSPIGESAADPQASLDVASGSERLAERPTTEPDPKTQKIQTTQKNR